MYCACEDQRWRLTQVGIHILQVLNIDDAITILVDHREGLRQHKTHLHIAQWNQ